MGTTREEARVDVYVNGQPALNSIKQVEAAMRELKAIARSTEDEGLRSVAAAKFKEYKKQVDDFNDSLKNTPGAWARIKEGAASFGLAFGLKEAGSMLKDFLVSSVAAFDEAELNAQRLKMAVSSNGGLAGDFKKLIEQSEKLQDSTIFSDDDIQNAQTMGLHADFTAKQIEKMLPIITDFASGTKQELGAAMEAVIRGSEGSAKGLKLYGIEVDASQSKGERLSSILQQLTDKFHGQAQQVALTSAGFKKQMGNAWDDVQEKFGGVLEDMSMSLLYFWDRSKYYSMLGMKGIAKAMEDAEKNNIIFQDAYGEQLKNLSVKQLEGRLVLLLGLQKKYADEGNKQKKKEIELEMEVVNGKLTEAGLIKKQNAKDVDQDVLREHQKFMEQAAALQEQYNQLEAEAVTEASEREVLLLEAKYQKDIDANRALLIVKNKLSEQEMARNEKVAEVERALVEKHERERAAIIEKWRIKLSDEDLKRDQSNLEEWNSQQKLAITKSLEEGLITEQTYQTKLNDLQLQYLTLKIKNLKDYDHSAVEVEQQMADLMIKINKDKNARINEQFKEEFSHLSTDTQEQLTLQINALQMLLATGINVTGQSVEEMMAKIKELMSGTAEAADEKFKKVVGKIAGYAQSFGGEISKIWGSIVALQNAKSDQALTHQKKNYDAERNVLQKQLKWKTITQEKFDAEMAAIDEKQQAAERKAAYDRAKREKRMAIFNAILQGAQAVLMALGSAAPPVNFILAALTAVATGIQVAAIAKAPLPELGKGKEFSGIGKHPSSTQQVIDSSGNAYYVEDGEVLLSAATAQKNPIVKRLLDASLNSNGEMDSSDVKFMQRELPQVNSSRIGETARMMRGSFGSMLSPTMDKSMDASSVPAAFSPVGKSTGPVDRSDVMALHETLKEVHAVLDHLKNNPVKAALDPRQYKKDLSRWNKITGNN